MKKAVYKAAKYCSKMYKCLEEGNPLELGKAGRKFVSQYMALEAEATSVDAFVNEAMAIQSQIPFDQPHTGSSVLGAQPKGFLELPR